MCTQIIDELRAIICSVQSIDQLQISIRVVNNATEVVAKSSNGLLKKRKMPTSFLNKKKEKSPR